MSGGLKYSFEILSDLLCCRLDWQQAQEMFEEYGFEQEAFDIFKEIVEEFYPYV